MKRRMITLVSVALLASFASVGCGSKTTTTAIEPDTAPPAAVTGFVVELNATQDPTVMLTWNPSAELDLAGYNIYRRQLLPAGREMDEITVGMDQLSMVTEEIFTDNMIMAGATYVYGISAMDVSGNESSRVVSMPVKITVTDRSGDDDLRLN